jgi:hypothetical protein
MSQNNENNKDTQILIKNKDEINSIIEKAKITTQDGKNIVLFTNGNSWYIDTLIKNLLESMKLNEKPEYNKVIVFCSDKEGYKKAKEHNFEYYEFVDIPDLKISDILENNTGKREYYIRLTFVKIALMYHILNLGYYPVYLDPDMAFKEKSIDDLFSYLTEEHDFIISGTKEHVNSNIMIAKPNIKNNFLFFLRNYDIDFILNNLDCNSDEEFIIIKLALMEKLNVNINVNYICQKTYPPGCDTDKYKDEAKIFHANCVSGLGKKIEFLKKFNVWFI